MYFKGNTEVCFNVNEYIQTYLNLCTTCVLEQMDGPFCQRAVSTVLGPFGFGNTLPFLDLSLVVPNHSNVVLNSC